ncbi:MAG: GNAT family N-acetyltransferase [Desulfobacterales bacterium]|nr:GNAT family N-acetyltransferase [Desulfobacterales bacterium]MBS3756426.1 GNAT family N-acetyltransferase [Desulfobacterales bacterium]
MDLQAHCPEKILAPEKAVQKIKNGSRVFIGTGCGEPQQVIRSMVEDESIQDIVVYQMLSSTFAQYVDDPHFANRFSLKLFFISLHMRQAAFEGKIDYIPAYLSQIPDLFDSRQIGLDVALVQVSPPDRFGYCSLGISVDITVSGMENAPVVIAQVNPRMPRTWGDGFVHVDDIDYLVPYEEPLVEALPEAKNQEILERIAKYINQLVDDGSTLQVGFGHLPNSILQHLTGKKDLGLHTQVITDGFLPLFQQGVITNKKKSYLSNRVVTSLCMGSEQLYKFMDDNPMFYFRVADFVNDPNIIAKNDNLISISSALEIDLTGQICTDSKGYLFYSGIGDQVDFLRGSKMSRGGFSIIAIPSTAQGGQVSRIVPHLSEGAGVATTRGDVDIVVTEYGIAELHGKGIYQRVMELAQIAHPSFREWLIEEAKKRHYIFGDQVPPSKQDLMFLENYKSHLELESGKTVEFRPLLPSDEFATRNFYYSLQESTVFYRFFYRRKIFSREMLQKQWASVDYHQNMTVVGMVQRGKHKEIVAIGSYGQAEKDVAEVAFVVKEDYQGMGLGSYLLELLERIARENKYNAFTATVLSENRAMIRVFEKRYPNAEIKRGFSGELEIYMPFDQAADSGTKADQGAGT